ncbi:hypothetical protein SISNIDRAFT_452627 [Sistotremastrum niveocremeum HHB9708]|uniref:Uncharacterized protein n=2 Tax=Sistotremastraceae TaxID=3402574 RepID=A0A164WQU4_9AGAM|nr:hypothetical protein SISNIDRAFT_452627 [Sistotremastrum niveocremeum HHB9708]KZT35898.1 hypothetical protein SISSUDRAFT_1050693 [Sistotremastrum suecicum HHB10207 ss-3]
MSDVRLEQMHPIKRGVIQVPCESRVGGGGRFSEGQLIQGLRDLLVIVGVVIRLGCRLAVFFFILLFRIVFKVELWCS